MTRPDYETHSEQDAARHARFNDEGPRYAGPRTTEPMPSAREAARDEAELGGER